MFKHLLQKAFERNKFGIILLNSLGKFYDRPNILVFYQNRKTVINFVSKPNKIGNERPTATTLCTIKMIFKL